MSGERKNTITKSATANTTTKKCYHRDKRYSDCHRSHDLGLFISSDENRADRNAAILYYRTAFLHCIYYRCTGFLAENEADEPAHSWIWKYSRTASVWCVCFSCSGNEIHDRFQCGFLVGIVSVFVPVVHSFLKTQTTIKRTTLGVLLALLGICLLTFLSTFTIYLGDILCYPQCIFLHHPNYF